MSLLNKKGLTFLKPHFLLEIFTKWFKNEPSLLLCTNVPNFTRFHLHVTHMLSTVIEIEIFEDENHSAHNAEREKEGECLRLASSHL